MLKHSIYNLTYLRWGEGAGGVCGDAGWRGGGDAAEIGGAAYRKSHPLTFEARIGLSRERPPARAGRDEGVDDACQGISHYISVPQMCPSQPRQESMHNTELTTSSTTIFRIL